MSEIHIAAETGDIQTVLRLLNAGIDVEATDEMGYSPLRLAAASGHTEIVTMLLEHGADANAADESEFYTALMGASANGQLEVARLLLRRGANVNARDDYDATALTRAAESSFTSPVCAKMVSQFQNLLRASNMSRYAPHNKALQLTAR